MDLSGSTLRYLCGPDAAWGPAFRAGGFPSTDFIGRERQVGDSKARTHRAATKAFGCIRSRFAGGMLDRSRIVFSIWSHCLRAGPDGSESDSRLQGIRHAMHTSRRSVGSLRTLDMRFRRRPSLFPVHPAALGMCQNKDWSSRHT